MVIQQNKSDSYRQSISNAWPFSPMVIINWSMIPHGTKAKLCSAFWQRSAFCFFSVNSKGEWYQNTFLNHVLRSRIYALFVFRQIFLSINFVFKKRPSKMHFLFLHSILNAHVLIDIWLSYFIEECINFIHTWPICYWTYLHTKPKDSIPIA